MNKPITLCDRCDIAASCLLNYDGVPCRKNRTVEPTRADRVRAMTDEELAEFMASQVVAMADAIFGIAERVLMEKRGYKISFTDNFTPDLVEIKREYLEMLRQEVEDAT